MAGEEDVVVEAATAAANINNDMEEIREDAEDEGAPGEGLGNALPAARVKRIMRKNPDKKKNFSKDTVLAVSMATELFLDDMVKKSHEFTIQKRRKTMQLSDIAECIKAEPRYEFVDGPGILPMIQDKKSNSKPETVPVNNALIDNNETKSDRPADEVRGVEGDASNVVAADDVINASNNETKDVAVVQESPQTEEKSDQALESGARDKSQMHVEQ